MNTYIHHISALLPKSVPLEQLAELENMDQESFNYLSKGGFERVCVAQSSVIEMIDSLFAQMQQENALSDNLPDYCLLSTESIGKHENNTDSVEQIKRTLLSKFAALDINHMPIQMSNLSGCGNTFSTLQLAQCLIKGGAAKRIMCLFADRCEKIESRVLQEYGVRGDGALAIIVSDAPSDIAYSCLTSTFDPTLACLPEDTHYLKRFLNKKTMMEQAKESAEGKSSCYLSDYSRVLVDSFHTDFLKLVAQNMGLDHQKFYYPYRASKGHVPPIDTLLSIQKLHRDAELGKMLLLNLNNYGVGLIEIEIMQQTPVFNQ